LEKKVILHIPHSSSTIPFYDGFVVDEDVLNQEILKLTDWHTDDLFHSPANGIEVKADFSRIFCDVERFQDDKMEVMAKFGMGFLYFKSDDGRVIREVTPTLRENILKNYYGKHHYKLTTAVNNQLDSFGKALILDCHSYPNKPFIRDLNQSPDRPDFSIGTDSFHTPRELIQLSVDFFKKAGFSLEIDSPYSGSIVPLDHYGKNKNVQSIMLEINRKLYLEEESNNKSDNYITIKKIVQEYIGMLSFCYITT
jgi:N-formylglutamate deformylase